MSDTSLLDHNARAWDKQAQSDSPWSQPVSSEQIEQARRGQWQVHLLPSPVPSHWLGDIQGKSILCLASAGGQQAPILAAAGAQVTVFDLSTGQLHKDCMVAERDGLSLTVEQGDMRDLSRFASDSFDLILHPVSNQYVPKISLVWKECARTLRPGGQLLSSFFNPAVFIADRDPSYAQQGLIRPKFTVPYSDLTSLDKETLQAKQDRMEPLIFGHSLAEQIGGQLEAGLHLLDYIEEMHPAPRFEIEKYLPSFIATRSGKPV